jgi:hypothetical protein
MKKEFKMSVAKVLRFILLNTVVTIVSVGVTNAQIEGSTDSAMVNERGRLTRDWNPRTTIGFSPFDLVHPIVRVQTEIRVAKDGGMAVQFGAGEVDNKFALAVGAQYSWYAIGDFEHGMQVGGIAMYSSASNALTTRGSVGRGVAMGPVIGYKYVAPFGFSMAATTGPLLLRFVNETPAPPSGTYIESGFGIGIYATVWMGWTF